MFIYIIIKILLSLLLVLKLKWIKEVWKVSLGLDFLILLGFFYLIFVKEINIITEIFVYSMIIIFIFLLYKLLNYIDENEIKIIKKIIENEKIKKILIDPWTCKIVYYMIWMLPWNIGYWIYFWIQENGWYARVWFSSTRDIIFWKMFKWDSREYFYKLFEKIKKNKINIYVIQKKNKIIKVIYRLLYVISYIRGEIQEMKISKYIWMRMIIYMYLTIFYFYVFEELYIINIYLFYGLIILELFVLYKAEEIINYFESSIIEAWKIMKKPIDVLEIKLYMFKNPFVWSTYYKLDWSLSFWDNTLYNSISLNILYKYILFVNKNTKGYFDKQMNIGTRFNYNRLTTTRVIINTVIWNVLPRTRYIIINLKCMGYDTIFNITNIYIKYDIIAKNKVNLINNKNLYLSYYEKTYSKTSLLMLIWILRNNIYYWDLFLSEMYISYINAYKKYEYNTFFRSNNLYNKFFMITYLIYMEKYDKRLIKDINMILVEFFNGANCYFNEEMYMLKNEKELIENGNKLPIGNKICGLRTYKKMFKIMGRIMWREEETVNWNLQLFEMLYNFKNKYLDLLSTTVNDLKFLSEKEKEFYDLIYEKYYQLRGVEFLNEYIFQHKIYFKSNIEFISGLIKFKNKEEHWLYNNFDKLYNVEKDFKDLEKLEIEDTYISEFLIDEKKEINYLTILYFLILNQHLFYENIKFEKEIDEKIFKDKKIIVNVDFIINKNMENERLKEYKDWKDFYKK